MNGWMDRRTDGQTGGWKDVITEGWIDREMDRHTNSQTNH